jgi:hypothetical protein
MKRIAVITGSLLLCGGLCAAEQPAAPAVTNVVLDLNNATFRAFTGWRTPTLISADGKLKPLLEPKRKDLKDEDRKPWPVHASTLPPANPSASGSGPVGWMAPDFDDSAWPKLEINEPAWNPRLLWVALAVRSYSNTDALNRPGGTLEGNVVCLRSTFRVTDPAQVKDLKLDLGYFGGAVVYINGVELQRGHLPEGKIGFDTLATRYPDEAYIVPENKIRSYAGMWIYGYYNDMRVKPYMLEGMKVWTRALPPKGAPDGVIIPSSMLRKGVNTIAIGVNAAPVHERFFEKTDSAGTWTGSSAPWPHAMVVSARLTSLSTDGLDISGAAAGIQLVNCQPVETIFPNEVLPPDVQVDPIRLVGTRNGTFSGQAALLSADPIRNLKASVSELAAVSGKGRIPAAALQVRLAEVADPKTGWLNAHHVDRLLSEFPAEIPAIQTRIGGIKQAVAPVWVTVHVPADAVAGEYQGTLTLEAEGKAPAKFTVPVRLKVNDWRLPDAKAFTIHNNIIQSPDSLARYYSVPMWSDKHFELIGKSLKAFNEVGNKLCVVNLVVNSITLGNSEGMVRWVKKPDGTFDYDFTIAEKYMDLYEKNCGKPGVLRLDAWQRTQFTNNPTPPVTVLDPATGKLETMPQPPFGTPENEAFWRPVLTELRKRLEKRGWFDVAAFGWVHYSKSADAPLVDTFHKIWPDGKWMHTAHTNPGEYPGTTKDVKMPVLCDEYVWGAGNLYDPDNESEKNRQFGGHYPRPCAKPGRIVLGFARYGVQFINAIYDRSSLAAYRMVPEAAIQGNLRGLGYLGGDFWPLPLRENRYAPVSYPYNGIAMSDCIVSCFSPGPAGTIFNVRMEMFREGVQVTEGILFLHRALEEKKAGDELAKKIADLLDERARYYLRAEGPCSTFNNAACSAWQDRDDRLFALCAEVAAAAERK